MTLGEVKNNIGAAVKLIPKEGIIMIDWDYNCRLGYIIGLNKSKTGAMLKLKDQHSIKKFGSQNLPVAAEKLELIAYVNKSVIEELIKKLEL